jgi:type II secretory pathway pseudopilin PulG
MIELMIVVTIIGILAAIVIPNYIKFTKRAKESVVKENMHTVQLAIESFATETLGVYPQAADEVALLALLPHGRYPDNPFTNAVTIVDWNVDPVAAGNMGIFNMPGGGYRIKGHGSAALLEDIVVGD